MTPINATLLLLRKGCQVVNACFSITEPRHKAQFHFVMQWTASKCCS